MIQTKADWEKKIDESREKHKHTPFEDGGFAAAIHSKWELVYCDGCDMFYKGKLKK